MALVHHPLKSIIAPILRLVKFTFLLARRYWWKAGIWLVTIATLAWQYENWHGSQDLATQRDLWKQEYSDMRLSDLAPPRIADEENFFAAPVFQEMATYPVQTDADSTAPPASPQEENKARIQKAISRIPNAKFLRLQFPTIENSTETVADIPGGQGLMLLDTGSWAEDAARDKVRPAGKSDSQWLSSTFPPDKTLNGLITALSRRKSAMLPHAADRWKVGEELGNPFASPINAMTNVFGNSKSLAFRARAAARAGEAGTARQINEILWLLCEGLSQNASLVGNLVSLAVEDMAESATAEGLASQCWNDADLAVLCERMTAIDENRSTLHALYVEAFAPHLWEGPPISLFNESLSTVVKGTGTGDRFFKWCMLHSPRGWVDANMANHLRWWRMLLVPKSGGDDLLALKTRMSTGLVEIRKLYSSSTVFGIISPRRVCALILMPAMTNFPENALRVQTKRRQLLLAAGIERFILAHGRAPLKPEDLVPALLPAIPGDPWQPGTPLRWEAGTGGVRYRILCAEPGMTLGFPAAVPK